MTTRKAAAELRVPAHPARRKHPALRRQQFFRGHHVNGGRRKDLTWLRPDGEEMTEVDWHQPFGRVLGMFVAGDAFEEHDERGVQDPGLGSDTAVQRPSCRHRVPAAGRAGRTRWAVLLDTHFEEGERPDRRNFHSHEYYPLQGRSVVC
jgi:isoamylase